MTARPIHFCLLSDQLIPNLLPVVNPVTRPAKVVFLVTPRMAREKDRLARLRQFVEKKCAVAFEDFSAFDYTEIRDIIRTLIDRYRPEGEVVLNATGGTKIMSLGALDVFREEGLASLYVDSENGQFIRLGPGGTEVSPIPANIFSVNDYVTAVGFEVIGKSLPQVNALHQAYVRFLLENAERMQSAQAKLNYFASQISQGQPWRGDSFNLNATDLKNKRFVELAQYCHEAGFVQFSERERRLVFHSQPGWDLIRGGWLEMYLAPILKNLKKEGLVTDFAINLEVLSPKGVKNEMDAVFTAKNRLHIIECKSGRMTGGRVNRADTVVYKLDNLRDLIGGDYGKAMLVTYWPISEADRKRLGDNGMQIAEGVKLLDMEHRLRTWASKA
ncbi:MAG: DUF1887 family CARF protein [Trichloromonas sp.]|jgi:hypothetical protein|nr:DUF1887 family CARF protein [Trichloromonas sp.]